MLLSSGMHNQETHLLWRNQSTSANGSMNFEKICYLLRMNLFLSPNRYILLYDNLRYASSATGVGTREF